jgi:hypothetical protein
MIYERKYTETKAVLLVVMFCCLAVSAVNCQASENDPMQYQGMENYQQGGSTQPDSSSVNMSNTSGHNNSQESSHGLKTSENFGSDQDNCLI